MTEEIENRVQKSGLVQIDLDDYYPPGERILFDLKPILKDDLVLIEKDLRNFVKEHDWSMYQDKYVGITCSSDAVVPLWAFMLVATYLKPFAKRTVFGGLTDLEKVVFTEALNEIDFSSFNNKSVIVKGCGKHPIPEEMFIEMILRLQEHAKSIMYGEACSAVPLFKQTKKGPS